MNDTFYHSHKLLLREMPHVLLYGKEDDPEAGYFDLYREKDPSKQKWLFNVVEIIKENPEKKVEIIKHLLEDKTFLLAFKIDYERADEKVQAQLQKDLPEIVAKVLNK